MGANVKTLSSFSPPAFLDELGEKQADWSEYYISQWMKDEIKGNVIGPNGEFSRDPLAQFFNGTTTAYDITQDKHPAQITWIAFPKQVLDAPGLTVAGD